jgi:hypothetical protein
MAWEPRRNGRTYYYRSRRVQGRVVKEYMGGSEHGRQAAAADQAARDSRRQAERLHKEKNKDVDALVIQLNEFDKLIEQLVTCQLICSGWRQHHRQWRPPTNDRRCHDRDT